MSTRSLRLALRSRDWRQAFVALVLAAFVAQSALTQGHWHTAAGEPAFASSDVSPASGHPGKPIKGDQTNCPICHAASVAGAFFASTAPALRVPPLGTRAGPRDERAVVVERFVAHWLSRAPPAV